MTMNRRSRSTVMQRGGSFALKAIAAVLTMAGCTVTSHPAVVVGPTSEPWTWVPAEGGAIPQGAVPGGSENGHPLFICHAEYNGGVHPGKVVGQNCNFGWGGREILSPRYAVLVGSLSSWVPASGGAVPQGAVRGGHENGQPLFICRAQYNGGVHPGKVVGQNCNIGWGGREILNPTYEVLVH